MRVCVRSSSAGSVGVEEQDRSVKYYLLFSSPFSRSIRSASSLYGLFSVGAWSAPLSLSPHVPCVSAVRLPLGAWTDQSAPTDYFRLGGSLPLFHHEKKKQPTTLVCLIS